MIETQLINNALGGMGEPIGPERCTRFVAALAGCCMGAGYGPLANMLRDLYRADGLDACSRDAESVAPEDGEPELERLRRLNGQPSA